MIYSFKIISCQKKWVNVLALIIQKVLVPELENNFVI